jgi:hypothetical protein
LLAPPLFAAQALPATHPTVRSGKPLPAHQRSIAAEMKKPVSEPAVPPAAPTPLWPINAPPRKPSVHWNGHVLSIDAMNSSLQQILQDVVSQTGAQIQGLRADQRVFGVYGPGKPRKVLAQLLEGTSYNFLIVGDLARGEPLKIILSVRPKGGMQPNAPVSESGYAPMPQSYVPPPALSRPQPQRTPQQILQQMQQREQLLREQQMRLEQMRQQNHQ